MQLYESGQEQDRQYVKGMKVEMELPLDHGERVNSK